MPNICGYEMRVVGRAPDVDAFVRLLQADYDEFPKHFWRVFSAEIYNFGEEIEDECVEYCETYFEDEKDFNERKANGGLDGYTWDDVDENGVIKSGGFGEWSFKI